MHAYCYAHKKNACDYMQQECMWLHASLHRSLELSGCWAITSNQVCLSVSSMLLACVCSCKFVCYSRSTHACVGQSAIANTVHVLESGTCESCF